MSKRILCIGGVDSSTGAGVTADLEVLKVLGAKGILAITSITAQSDERFFSSHPVSVDGLQAQLKSSESLSIDAIKIGMIPDGSAIQVVSKFLDNHTSIPIIMDPVLSTTSGGKLINFKDINILKKELFTKVSLVTPNALEAKEITGHACQNVKDAEQSAELFLKLGVQAVLIKGGHLLGPACTDILLQKNQPPKIFTKERIKNLLVCRGTGCRLSTAIAYFMACNDNLSVAVENATAVVERYIQSTIRPNA